MDHLSEILDAGKIFLLILHQFCSFFIHFYFIKHLHDYLLLLNRFMLLKPNFSQSPYYLLRQNQIALQFFSTNWKKYWELINLIFRNFHFDHNPIFKLNFFLILVDWLLCTIHNNFKAFLLLSATVLIFFKNLTWYFLVQNSLCLILSLIY